MQLAELIKDWPCTVKGSIRIEVTGVEDDVQQVKPGYLFVARKGRRYDGIQFVEQAITLGACGIVVEEELQLDILNIAVPIIWVPNALSFLSFASAKLLHFPSEALHVTAVTGTNGKTTVTHFIGQLLTRLGERVMVIGTNGVYVNGQLLPGEYESLTTLPAKQLHQLMKKALDEGIHFVVLEASSMGLATHRLDHCDINIGIFLNLAEDHLDDHITFDNYKLAKQRLISLSERLVLNGDDAFCRSIGVLAKKRKRYFGGNSRVDVQMQLITEEQGFSTCCLQTEHEQQVITLPLVGEYQRSNALAAITAVCEAGFPFEEVCQVADSLKLPEGRMQQIPNELGITIIVDYAHTAEAFRAILQTVRFQTEKRVIVVFSCGGERDHAKRPKMGLMASKFSDFIVLTTDNARGENPKVINKQIQEGFLPNQLFEVEYDRKKAIEKALKLAETGDTVVIVGKGHERTQTIGKQITPFSDIESVYDVLNTSLNNKK